MRLRNSFRMSSMPLTMRWPSRNASGSTPKRSSSRMRSATARGLAAAVHGDAEIGLLQRQHVVDAVADHRYVMAALAQRLDELLLLARRYAAEDGRLGRHVSQTISIQLSQLEARNGRIVKRDTSLASQGLN